MSERVTIKSIARDLGMSHMTVSRALSGHSGVQTATRDAVLERALALGYVKSAAASAMRGTPTRIVGLLLPNLANAFYAGFADAMAHACDSAALHLVIHLTNDEEQNERQAMMRLREVQASAVVLVPTPRTAPAPMAQSLRIVHLIRTHDAAPALLVDDSAAMGSAVDHLVARGHREIGFIGADLALSSGRERFTAFRAALESHGLAMRGAFTITAPPSFRMGHDSATELMKTHMTALVCGGFEISNGALDACMSRGLRLPDDLAFIGYGDPDAYQWIAHGITTLRLPVTEMAQAAVRLLATSDDPVPIARFSAALIIRRST
jgi:DNA-binding LacI/PurR family transcriptional regulator